MTKHIKKVIFAVIDFVFPKSLAAKQLENMSVLEFLKKVEKDLENLKNIESLFSYKDPLVRDLIWELKYKRNRDALRIASEVLYDHLIEVVSERVLFYPKERPVLVPIPISRQRRMKRGFNQMEVLIERILKIDVYPNSKAGRGGIFDYDFGIIKKTKETIPQSKIKNRKERLENIKNCFKITNSEKAKGAYIILIDDVTTTGATIREVEKILKEAGAKKITAFTIAH